MKRTTLGNSDSLRGTVQISELKGSFLDDEMRFVVSWTGGERSRSQSIALSTTEAQALARHLNSIVGSE